MRTDTQFIYDQRKVSSLVIQPGEISEIALSAFDSTTEVARRKDMWLKLAFKPKNTIAAGGVIVFTFPPLFDVIERNFLNEPTSYYIESGLANFNSDKPVSWSFDSINKELTVINFDTYTKNTTVGSGLINLVFYAKVPDLATTIPIKITSYSDLTKVTKLDENNVDAIFNLASVGAPITNNIIENTNPQTISQSSGIKTHVKFSYQPSINIPVNSMVKVKFPAEDLYINAAAISAANC